MRRFVKRSIDNQKKLFFILVLTAAVSGLFAFLIQYFFGESRVYRGELYVELNAEVKPTVNIYTAGMMVDLAVWEGSEVKIECVAELPIIVETDKFGEEITISQDDGFAVSIFTLDMFRYKLKVFLPQHIEYKSVSVITSGGNIDVDSYLLKAERVSVETKNAAVKVLRANCVYVIRTQSGDVYMDYDYLMTAAVIESESGNILIKVPDYNFDKSETMLRARTENGELDIIKKDTNLPENYPLL
jgi:DUF4097 and DUF4098 domain-containing protein YvlB